MELVTKFELAARDENELHGLLKEAFNEPTRSEPEARKTTVSCSSQMTKTVVYSRGRRAQTTAF